MPNGIQISKETFETFDVEGKLNTLFDLILGIDRRLERLEKRSLFNKSLAFVGGLVGGFVAIFGKWMVGR
jgi:hypothetical protein